MSIDKSDNFEKSNSEIMGYFFRNSSSDKMKRCCNGSARTAKGRIVKVPANFTFDTLGSLVLDTAKNKRVDYEYNKLNLPMKRPP